MPLKPHHVFGMETPRLTFECFGREILRTSALKETGKEWEERQWATSNLHVVKDEEESVRGETIVEFRGIAAGGRCLRVVRNNLSVPERISPVDPIGIGPRRDRSARNAQTSLFGINYRCRSDSSKDGNFV